MTAIERGVRILEFLATASGDTTHTVLAKELGIAPSTLTDILKQLRKLQWIERDGANYRIGLGALTFAGHAIQANNVRLLLQPTVERLAFETGETAALMVEALGMGEVVAIYVAEGHNPVRAVARVGDRMSMSQSAAGLALMAFSGRNPRDLPEFDASAGDADDAALRRKLRRILTQGYAKATPPEISDFDVISAPVLDRHGYPVAAISLLGPKARMQRDAKHLIEQLLFHVDEATNSNGADA